jgi:hypothetical protein
MVSHFPEISQQLSSQSILLTTLIAGDVATDKSARGHSEGSSRFEKGATGECRALLALHQARS